MGWYKLIRLDAYWYMLIRIDSEKEKIMVNLSVRFRFDSGCFWLILVDSGWIWLIWVDMGWYKLIQVETAWCVLIQVDSHWFGKEKDNGKSVRQISVWITFKGLSEHHLIFHERPLKLPWNSLETSYKTPLKLPSKTLWIYFNYTWNPLKTPLQHHLVFLETHLELFLNTLETSLRLN